MRTIIQRVQNASVEIDDKVYNTISKGYCIFLGIECRDNDNDINYIIDKLLSIKLFDGGDKKGYFNKSLSEINGEILLISQFTLYGSLKKGTKPSFTDAMNPKDAEMLYNKFVENLKSKYNKVKTGEFAAYMKVNIENDGPATFILDSKNKNNG